MTNRVMRGTMKRNQFIALGSITLAFVIGFGAASARGTLRFGSESGLLSTGRGKQGSFGQMFDKLAHLGTIEYAAANCSGRGDMQTVLTNERKMLKLLAEEN